MTTAPAFYGVPHCAVPPLEVSIRPVRTEHGERFTVCAKDDRGQWQPLIKEPKFDRAVLYLTRDFAMRAYKKWKGKDERAAGLMMFVEHIKDSPLCNS